MEHEKNKNSAQTISPTLALVLGIVMLIPIIVLIAQFYLLPAVGTFQTAMTDGNVLRTPEYVGMENYEKLAEDEQFFQSLGISLQYVVTRIVAIGLVAPIVGVLAGMQPRAGRLINRVLMSVVSVLVVPVLLAVIWSMYWAPNWGVMENPVFNEAMALMRPDSAQLSMITLDYTLMAGLAVAVGATVYMAVMRSQRKLLAGGIIWFCSIILAGASGFLVFDAPFIATNGGPGNSTSPMMFFVYRVGLQYFDFGYASAILTYVIIGAVVVGMMISVLTVATNLRITYTTVDDAPKQRNWLSLISVPIILAIAYPLINYLLWSNWASTSPEVVPSPAEPFDYSGPIALSLTPWITIWLIHLPVTYFAALALGFLRPFGKIGTNILFIVLFAISMIPMEGVMFEWFTSARDMGMLDSPSVLGLPWMVNAFSLLVLKLLFDGLREKFDHAVARGDSAGDALVKQVILPSLPFVVIVGVALSFISAQSMWWSLLSQNSRENMNMSVTLLQLRSTMMTQVNGLAGGVFQFFIMLAVPFMILIVLLQVFVLDRVAIEAGDPLDPEKLKRGEEPSPEPEPALMTDAEVEASFE